MAHPHPTDAYALAPHPTDAYRRAYPSSAPPPPGDYGYGYSYPPPPAYGYPPPQHPPPGYGYPPPGPPGHHPPPPGYGYPPPGYPPPGYPPPGYPPPSYWPPPPGAYGGGYGREPSRSRSPRREGKYTCRFFIGIENDNKFKVAKRIIGGNGANMKEIVRKSGDVAKLRLRGKGSGFAERDTGEESPEPLQLCISCPTQRGYDIARKCAEELLLRVYDEYEDYCSEKGLEVELPTIKMTERHMSGDTGGAQGSGAGRKGNRRERKKPKAAAKPKEEDHGERPEGAPGVEEIEELISERNACRKRGEYSKADEIRDDLKERGVVLSDEKGAHGEGLNVKLSYWSEEDFRDGSEPWWVA
eukprot:g25411.t1